MNKSKAGRPRRELRPGEDPAALQRRRLADLQRYYTQDPKLRWARAALSQARKRALAASLVFALTLGDILFHATDVCPALGTPLNYSRGRIVMQDDSATVDRLRPEDGYTPQNIAVISAKANTAKGRCEPHEIMAVARWQAQRLAAG